MYNAISKLPISSTALLKQENCATAVSLIQDGYPELNRTVSLSTSVHNIRIESETEVIQLLTRNASLTFGVLLTTKTRD